MCAELPPPEPSSTAACKSSRRPLVAHQRLSGPTQQLVRMRDTLGKVAVHSLSLGELYTAYQGPSEWPPVMPPARQAKTRLT